MKKIPQIKKDIKVFLTSEEAKITKKNALKMGLGISAALFILQSIESMASHDAHASTHVVENVNSGSPARLTGRHVAHNVHSSHGSHGSHGQW